MFKQHSTKVRLGLWIWNTNDVCIGFIKLSRTTNWVVVGIWLNSSRLIFSVLHPSFWRRFISSGSPMKSVKRIKSWIKIDGYFGEVCSSIFKSSTGVGYAAESINTVGSKLWPRYSSMPSREALLAAYCPWNWFVGEPYLAHWLKMQSSPALKS